MQKLLVLDSSVSRDQSVSRRLVQHGVQRVLEAYPSLETTYRDLDADPVPHLTSSTVMGVRGVAASSQELGAQALSDAIVGEVQGADILILGAPMYNFSIPTTLRAYFDHLLRPGLTFSYTEAGPQGLLTGKRAIVMESRGGLYSEGAATAIDFQEPYLRQLLRFIGITDVTFIRAEKVSFGPEAREHALALAEESIAETVQRIRSEAAVISLEPTGTPLAA